MNDRQAESLIDTLRDINRSLEKMDRSLDQIKDELREANN
jgi:hypothetical protein